MEYLKPTKTKVRPKKIVAFDSEDDSKGRVKAIGFYNGYKYFSFDTPIRALSFIYNYPIPRNQYVYFYAHNVEYDLVNLFRYRFDLIDYIKWNNFVISAKLRGRNIIFLDSLNLARTSLKNLGDLIGLKKLDFDPDDPAYLRRDCEIVYKYVTELQETLNTEYKVNLKYTLPSVAYEIFTRQFLQFEIFREVSPEIFRSYYGGRTEAFGIGEFQDVFYSDVNSMYPFIMRGYFPDTGTLADVDSIDAAFGYGKFTVKVDGEIPLLPFRSAGKIFFPRGEFTGVWTFEEIKQLPPGAVKKIHWAKGTDEGFPYFREFVDHFYNKRKVEKNEFLRAFYKLILNSLYGKFGEKLQGNEFVTIDDARKNKNKIDVNKILGNHCIITTGDIFTSKKSNPLWASYVTAGARVYLWKSLNTIKNRGGTPLYCDTDSIIYKGERDVLSESNNLGDWKTEPFKSVHIKGAKFYKMETDTDTVYRCKGIPTAEQDVFFDFGIAAFENPIKFRESLLVDKLTESQAQKIMNYWTTVVKERISKYDKRGVRRDGATYPLDAGFIMSRANRRDEPRRETLRNDILKFGGLKNDNTLYNKSFYNNYRYLFYIDGVRPGEMIYLLNDLGWKFRDADDLINKIKAGFLNVDRKYNVNLNLLDIHL